MKKIKCVSQNRIIKKNVARAGSDGIFGIMPQTNRRGKKKRLGGQLRHHYRNAKYSRVLSAGRPDSVKGRRNSDTK